MKKKSRKIVLHFSRDIWDKPIVCYLGKNFDLEFNILKAQVGPKEEGLVVLELTGPDDAYRKGTRYLRDEGVKIQPLAKDVVRRESKCTHCGACLAVCPTDALAVNRETWEVVFDPQQCIGCELCLPACPPRAMEIEF
jgi:ferredoxin